METRTGFGMTNCRFYRGVQFTSSARDCVIPVTGIERIVDSGQTRYEKVGNIGFRIALYLWKYRNLTKKCMDYKLKRQI